jgi:hypothetical protein
MLLALAALGLTACEEDILFGGEQGQDQAALSESFLTAQVRANFLYKVFDQTMRDSSFQATDSTSVEGATAQRASNGDILVDFGNGAVGSDGRTRSGQVRYTDVGGVPYTSAGAKYNLSFNNYAVESAPVTGSMSMENKGNNKIGLNLANFSVMEQTAFNANQEVQWDSGFATQNDLSDDLYSVSGTADLTDSAASQSIAATFTAPVKLQQSCAFGVTQGVLDLTFSGDSLDYNQGTMDFLAEDGCNNVVELTLSDGNSNEITVPLSFEGF